MQLVHGIKDFKKYSPGRICLALGNFDGVHAGHREILRTAVSLAAEKGEKSAVLLFSPHPQSVLFPQRPQKLLQPLKDRIWLLGETGIDYVIIHPFTKDFAAITAQEFAAEIICRQLEADNVVVGFNYTFGRNGSGTPADLNRYGKIMGFNVKIVDPVLVDGKVVGSTAIRELLAEGRMGKASLLLGRSFYLRGTVIHGDGRGRKLGFPTANLAVSSHILLPSNGVYLTKASCREITAWSVTNIGKRPTFGKSKQSIEVYLFDVDKNLYREELTVCFIKKLRDETVFPDASALSCQIEKDVEEARSIITGSLEKSNICPFLANPFAM